MKTQAIHTTSRILMLVAMMLPMLAAVAQVPQSMTYQAVVRDAAGNPVASTSVGVRFTLLQGNELGPTVWGQSGSARTDAAGLFTFVLTDMQSVDWELGPYFLRSEIDPNGGSDYSIASIQQFFSVPYAMHAAVADSIASGSLFGTEHDPVFNAWDRDYNSLTNLPTNVSTFTNDAGYLTSYTESQTLADVVALGNTARNQLKSVSDPTEALDAVNLQTLTLAVNTLTARFEAIIAHQNSLIDSLRLQLAKLSPNTHWGIDYQQACGSFTWINGQTYTASTTPPTHVLTAADGSDSVSVLHLTILPAFYQFDTLVATESLRYHGKLYTESGDYSIPGTNAFGCDSTYLLHLILTNPGSLAGDTIFACDSYTWWHGITYTTSGSYRDTLADRNGQDSIVALYLTLHRSSHTDTTAIACDSLAWHGVTYTKTGYYTDSTTLTINSQGCDSSQVLILLINPSTSSDTTIFAVGMSYNWNSQSYTTDGTYSTHFTNAAGCDSTATLHLHLSPFCLPTAGDTSIHTCAPLLFDGHTYTTSGNYTLTYTNVFGCDSTLNLHLTIGSPSAADTTATISAASFTWHGITCTASGTYRDTLVNASGCDSILTLHLTLQPSTTSWVDLGLPSGILWADRNLGAASPEAYGDYYAWAETSTKTAYSWTTYTYGTSTTTLTKYCNSASNGLNAYTDALTTLQPADDAATAILGNGSRTPTQAEWQELIDNIPGIWTTRSGIQGVLFTATNGNSIFLPAAGQYTESDLQHATATASYWSATLYGSYPYGAYATTFSSTSTLIGWDNRKNGHTIRAVK